MPWCAGVGSMQEKLTGHGAELLLRLCGPGRAVSLAGRAVREEEGHVCHSVLQVFH